VEWEKEAHEVIRAGDAQNAKEDRSLLHKAHRLLTVGSKAGWSKAVQQKLRTLCAVLCN
jgi:hypothetical protein